MLKKIQQFLKNKFLKILTFIGLTSTYFLGIGLTALVGKIVGKQFLNSQWSKKTKNTSYKKHSTQSTWQKTNYQTNLRKMY